MAIESMGLRSGQYQDSLRIHRVEPDIVDEHSGRTFASVGSCLSSGLSPWINYSPAQEHGNLFRYFN